jgi:hypothetical protein
MSRTKMANDMIRVQAGSLKMPGLKRSFEGLARQARQEAWSFEEFLYEVLSAESSSRAESSIRQKIHEARFPEPKTLGEFDFTAVEGIDEATILTLARGEWIPKAHNLILAGPIGTGKTHLAIALGIEAAKQRRSVAFHRTADLVRSLVEARDARPHWRRAPLQSDRRSLRATLGPDHDESRVQRVAEGVCRRREAHDGPARPPRPPRLGDQHSWQELPHAPESGERRQDDVRRRRREHNVIEEH